jgi:hypothetical protein
MISSKSGEIDSENALAFFSPLRGGFNVLRRPKCLWHFVEPKVGTMITRFFAIKKAPLYIFD